MCIAGRAEFYLTSIAYHHYWRPDFQHEVLEEQTLKTQGGQRPPPFFGSESSNEKLSEVG